MTQGRCKIKNNCNECGGITKVNNFDVSSYQTAISVLVCLVLILVLSLAKR